MNNCSPCVTVQIVLNELCKLINKFVHFNLVDVPPQIYLYQLGLIGENGL